MLLLMPVLLLIVLGVCWFAPALEVRLFGQPLFQWMDGNFVQRNALVAGIALGFALIPLIFSLAEDALFNVPARLSQGSLALGATPWQTLWHVVLPSASAGICRTDAEFWPRRWRNHDCVDGNGQYAH